VSEIQRARILAAMVEVVCERGAPEASVGCVVSRAGMSRRTFYELFDGREDCFLAAFDLAVARVAAGVVPAYRGAGAWRERVRAGLVALLSFLESEPDVGTLLIVEALGAGQRALQRRAEVLEVLIAAVDEGRGEGIDGRGRRRDGGRGRLLAGSGDELPPPLTAEGVVGAAFSIVHARMLERGVGGSARSLVELTNPLMAMIVMPYLGARAAHRELREPNPEHSDASRERHDPLKDLDMRLTYRTVRVLSVIAQHPGESNRQVGERAGVHDQGQTSKLLQRLERLGLIQTTGPGHAKGEPNAWTLTAKGHQVEQATRPVPTGTSR
jgi:AcrR family transcriptional regulator/DNA-binding MarR family transcriptional regulator